MSKAFNFIVVAIILIAVVVASGAFYVIDETRQVVITQLGEPIGEPITEAGLYFKLPFIQKANYFDKRLLQWDGDPNEIQTIEKRYIWVDTTARWRIENALEYMQSVGNEISAQTRLDDIIDGATRDVIASHQQTESIRDTNELIKRRESGDSIDTDFVIVETPVDSIEVGRKALTRKILNQAIPLVEDLGIDLVDVRIKRINYIEPVRAKVYDRMISERNAAAAKIRSEGQGKRARIEGQMQKELQGIQAEAYKQAQEIKGTADAKATKIYADAYNNDPEFYSFVTTLESYHKAINKDTMLILSTENEFYNHLQGSSLNRSEL